MRLDDLMALPERELSLWRFLESAAAGEGTVQVGQTVRSYRDIADRSAHLATGLREAGVASGDSVVTIMSDRIENIELLFACAHIGAMFAPISPYLKGEFLRYQLDEISPRVMIVDGPGFHVSEDLTAALPDLAVIVLVEETPAVTNVPTQPLASLYQRSDPGVAPAKDGRHPLTMLYTSGTTGKPKGCVCSQGYFIRIGAVVQHNWNIVPDDKLFTAFPLFHGAGLGGALMGMLVGGASYHNVGQFSASNFMADCGTHGGTVIFGPGAVGQALLAQPVRETDQSNQVRMASFIPFPFDAQQAFSERFAVDDVYAESYGMTECMVVSQGILGEERNRRSCGKATALVDLAIMNEDGDLVTPGQMGEIVFRPKASGCMFQGYWKKPEATLDAWKGLWHHTGDSGYMDSEGFLFFLDRKKDAMRRRGENVSSVELESAIMSHPKISSAAVHAIPSTMTEDDIKACLIMEPGQTVTAEDLFEFFRETLPYFAIPRYVEFLDEFPMTGSMKVRKEVLRERGVASSWDFESMGLVVSREDRRGKPRNSAYSSPAS